MRNVKPRKSVTGRWLLTIKTDEQGNFLKAKARWVLRGFGGQTEGISADGFACFHKTRTTDELPNGSQQELEHFSH